MTLAWIVIGGLPAFALLAELFERIGWGHAANVAAGLLGVLAFFGFPALAVYIVVKVRRGEITL